MEAMAVVLNQGRFCPWGGHLAMSGGFWLSQLVGGSCYWHLVGGQGCYKTQVLQCTSQTPTTKNFLAPNVNRAEAEKPQAMVMIGALESPLETPEKERAQFWVALYPRLPLTCMRDKACCQAPESHRQG